MIYALLAFFMVATAALGGVLYERSRDLGQLRDELRGIKETLRTHSFGISNLRSDLADVSRGLVNASGSEQLAARIVALERARDDAKRPQIVRGINEARRMANQMGGVEGAANAS